MIKEFEGKTEQEAIDNAISALGLNKDEIDVEIVDKQKSGLFSLKKKVLIRVYVEDEKNDAFQGGSYDDKPLEKSIEPENDFEHAILDFINNVTKKMGYPANSTIAERNEKKLVVRINSNHSGILIGKKGKNLDALQVLANVIANKINGNEIKVILDSENYRLKREEALIRMAKKVGEQVTNTKTSRLLEPMNPFERRLIHTTLSEVENIETKSEGEGLLKQVRVIYKNE
jgi:spoIIIJ-associated protein